MVSNLKLFFRRPIPCFSDPTNLSEGRKLQRSLRVSKRKKYRKQINIALPKLTDTRELQTRWISRNRLEKLWAVTNQPDMEDEEEDDRTMIYPDYDFDWQRCHNFDPPPGGSAGSFTSNR